MMDRSSKDASTNTPEGSPRHPGEEVSRQFHAEQRIPEVAKATRSCLVACHERALDGLPAVRKLFFCVPLRYGVYTILASEAVFFSLRAYTRVIHLAMPEFYPMLPTWMAATELVLCLLVLASDVFLLFGIFYNPAHMFFWIDIHLLQMLVYSFLIGYLAVTDSECVLECLLLYSAIFLLFFYFIMICNTFRKSWVPPAPSEPDLQAREIR